MQKRDRVFHWLSWAVAAVYTIIALIGLITTHSFHGLPRYPDSFGRASAVVTVLLFGFSLIRSMQGSVRARLVVMGFLFFYAGETLTFLRGGYPGEIGSFFWAALSIAILLSSVVALIIGLVSLGRRKSGVTPLPELPVKTVAVLLALFLLLMIANRAGSALSILGLFIPGPGFLQIILSSISLFLQGTDLPHLTLFWLEYFLRSLHIGLRLFSIIFVALLYPLAIISVLKRRFLGGILSVVLMVANTIPTISYVLEKAFGVFKKTFGLLEKVFGVKYGMIFHLTYPSYQPAHLYYTQVIAGSIAAVVAAAYLARLRGKILYPRAEAAPPPIQAVHAAPPPTRDSRAEGPGLPATPAGDSSATALHAIGFVVFLLLLFVVFKIELAGLWVVLALLPLLVVLSISGSTRARLLLLGIFLYLPLISPPFLFLFGFSRDKEGAAWGVFLVLLLSITALAVGIRHLGSKEILSRFSGKTPVRATRVFLVIASIVVASYWALLVYMEPSSPFSHPVISALVGYPSTFGSVVLVVLSITCVPLLEKRRPLGFVLTPIVLTATSVLWIDMFWTLGRAFRNVRFEGAFPYSLSLLIKYLDLPLFILPSIIAGIMTALFVLSLDRGTGRVSAIEREMKGQRFWSVPYTLSAVGMLLTVVACVLTAGHAGDRIVKSLVTSHTSLLIVIILFSIALFYSTRGSAKAQLVLLGLMSYPVLAAPGPGKHVDWIGLLFWGAVPLVVSAFLLEIRKIGTRRIDESALSGLPRRSALSFMIFSLVLFSGILIVTFAAGILSRHNIGLGDPFLYNRIAPYLLESLMRLLAQSETPFVPLILIPLYVVSTIWLISRNEWGYILAPISLVMTGVYTSFPLSIYFWKRGGDIYWFPGFRGVESFRLLGKTPVFFLVLYTLISILMTILFLGKLTFRSDTKGGDRGISGENDGRDKT